MSKNVKWVVGRNAMLDQRVFPASCLLSVSRTEHWNHNWQLSQGANSTWWECVPRAHNARRCSQKDFFGSRIDPLYQHWRDLQHFWIVSGCFRFISKTHLATQLGSSTQYGLMRVRAESLMSPDVPKVVIHVDVCHHFACQITHCIKVIIYNCLLVLCINPICFYGNAAACQAGRVVDTMGLRCPLWNVLMVTTWVFSNRDMHPCIANVCNVIGIWSVPIRSMSSDSSHSYWLIHHQQTASTLDFKTSGGCVRPLHWLL